MNKFNDHKTPLESLSKELMEAYLDGKLSGSMQHEVEKYLLDHPFEAEAMEGYAENPTAFNSLSSLDQILTEKINQKESAEKEVKVVPIWRKTLAMAASFILLLTATILAVYFYGGASNELPISLESSDKIDLKELKKETTAVSPPSIAARAENEDLEQAQPQQNGDIVMLKDQKKETLQQLAQINKTDDLEEVEQNLLKTAISKNSEIAMEEKVLDSNRINTPAQALLEGGTKIEENYSAEHVATMMKGSVAGVHISRSGSLEKEIINETINEEIALAEDGVAVKNETIAAAEVPRQAAMSKKMKTNLAPSKVADSAYLKDIQGIVTDADTGEPLAGVSILLKNSTAGVSTDLAGEFSISAKPGDVLVVNFIGMEQKEVIIADMEDLEISLSTDVAQLSEVVVTGYASAYGEEESSQSPYQSPQARGGMKEFKKYLEKQLQYPKDALEQKTEGIVKLKLSVDASGEISKIEVLKSLSESCDAEAIRLVKEGASWLPAKKDGKVLDSETIVKVRFKIN